MRVRITPEYPGLVIADTGEIQGPRGRWLKMSRGSGDYLLFSMRLNGKKVTRYPHTIVCTTFHGPRPTPDHQAAHGNGIKTDNRASNLRWATGAENQADRILHGTDLRGSRSPTAVLNEDQVKEIRKQRASGVLLRVLAEQYGVHLSTIGKITTNINWKNV